ncbi:hypothetical protein [Lysinibacillus sp. Ag94]|uniref:hypothetical protein n=1 Tax=Lysinibacillus sp. Ag94 TaxID=2936682 RepID=UPI00200DCD10|nr:hypothetical protein [Lysinibacillus sp. Ag94]UPW82705.1 hypothetical protein MY533_18620 [Lysinibacillus sp. Ag94]
MEETDKVKRVFRDIDKQKEQIRAIANPNPKISELIESFTFDEIEQQMLSFDKTTLSAVEYSKPYNPNEELERLAKQQLDVLNDIKQDTSLISNVILLIQQDVADSSKHLELIKEALEIAASTTKEEAESKLGKLLSKIDTTVEGVQNVQTLVNWAKTIYILYTSSN